MTEIRNPIESGFPELRGERGPLPHEVLEARGYEYVRSDKYLDEATAQKALYEFCHPKPGTPDFSKVYDPKSFKIVPYEGGFLIYGKKIVASPFAGGRRGRRAV